MLHDVTNMLHGVTNMLHDVTNMLHDVTNMLHDVTNMLHDVTKPLKCALTCHRCRERNFLKKVHECVARGGKILIPVFALGRAQV